MGTAAAAGLTGSGKLSERDTIRQKTDSSFHPSDDDWKQVSADYDKQTDYYSTLGVDEHEPRDGIEQAYKRLSKLYDLDSTCAADHATAQMRKAWSSTLHDAYRILSDNAIRRCYDRDRDTLARAAKSWSDTLRMRQLLAEKGTVKNATKCVDLRVLLSRPAGAALSSTLGLKIPDVWRQEIQSLVEKAELG